MKLTGLWLHPEFKKLWAGQTVSLIGTQVMFVSMVLTAITVLDASPFQMGMLAVMQGAPALIGLSLGAWADRRRKLPIIIGADVSRAILLLVAPVAYLFDVLTIELLYAVAFGIGSLSMLFQIGYRSLLPSRYLSLSRAIFSHGLSAGSRHAHPVAVLVVLHAGADRTVVAVPSIPRRTRSRYRR